MNDYMMSDPVNITHSLAQDQNSKGSLSIDKLLVKDPFLLIADQIRLGLDVPYKTGKANLKFRQLL